MWFSLGVNNLIAKKRCNNDSCDIFISNFANIWHEKLSDEDLDLISKKLNPLLEVSRQRNKEIILKLFEDEQSHKEVQEEETSITIRFESKKMGFKFKFEITLNKGSEEMLYKEFTLPLLLTVINLENREKKLIEIIKDKDAEINEYKEEYGTIKSNYIITKYFSEEEFNREESLTPVVSNSSIFFKVLEENEKSSKIKQEKITPNECNTEVISQNHKIEKSDGVFKDKNVKTSKSCVKLDHQIIKRKRKKNDSFKIKF